MTDKLSNRERELLQLAADGNSRKEIAAKMRIGFRTVGKYANWVFTKLDALNMPHAVAIGMRRGIIS